MDEQNIPGMDRVDSLAEYLVELRTSTGLTLSGRQVNVLNVLTLKLKNSVTGLCMLNDQCPFNLNSSG